MNLVENYKSWPARPIKIGYGEWAQENLYISEILGNGINRFARKTNFYPTHIIIGMDCRNEFERQVSQSCGPMVKGETLRAEICGLKIIWAVDNGISLMYSPEDDKK